MLSFLLWNVLLVLWYFSFWRNYNKYTPVFALSTRSSWKLNIVWETLRQISTNNMKSWMSIFRIFDFNFKVGSTTKILSDESNSAVICRKLNSKISLHGINIMSNDRCNLFIFFKLWWFKEALNVNFRLEKYDNWSFFGSLFIDIFHNFLMNFRMRAVFKGNHSIRFRINWWLLVHLLNSKSCFKNLFLTIAHACKCPCYTKNWWKVRWKFRVGESSYN